MKCFLLLFVTVVISMSEGQMNPDLEREPYLDDEFDEGLHLPDDFYAELEHLPHSRKEILDMKCENREELIDMYRMKIEEKLHIEGDLPSDLDFTEKAAFLSDFQDREEQYQDVLDRSKIEHGEDCRGNQELEEAQVEFLDFMSKLLDDLKNDKHPEERNMHNMRGEL